MQTPLEDCHPARGGLLLSLPRPSSLLPLLLSPSLFHPPSLPHSPPTPSTNEAKTRVETALPTLVRSPDPVLGSHQVYPVCMWAEPSDQARLPNPVGPSLLPQCRVDRAGPPRAFEAGIFSVCGVKTLILFSNSFWWFNRVAGKSNL